MAVPILKQGPFLIASIQSALTDTDLVQLRDALVGQVGSYRSRGVIVDVTALDVLDSFATRTLRGIAYTARRDDACRSGRPRPPPAKPVTAAQIPRSRATHSARLPRTVTQALGTAS